MENFDEDDFLAADAPLGNKTSLVPRQFFFRDKQLLNTHSIVFYRPPKPNLYQKRIQRKYKWASWNRGKTSVVSLVAEIIPNKLPTKKLFSRKEKEIWIRQQRRRIFLLWGSSKVDSFVAQALWRWYGLRVFSSMRDNVHDNNMFLRYFPLHVYISSRMNINGLKV